MLGALGCPFEIIEHILAHRPPGVAKKCQRSEYAPQKVEWLGRLNQSIDAIVASERAEPRNAAA